MYGAPNGFSAMAQTVGKPTAMAAKMILNGKIMTNLLNSKYMYVYSFPVRSDQEAWYCDSYYS